MRISDWSSDVCSSDLPGAFVAAIDMAQRLERDSARLAIMVATQAERMVCATHRQHRGARRKSLVKYIDLRTLVASELKCEQREQPRFAGAGRSDHQHMADFVVQRADPKRCRTPGPGVAP